MRKGLQRVITSVLLATAVTTGLAACGSPSLRGDRKELSHVVDAVPRPDGIVLTPCNDVDAFAIPDNAESLLASCFSTSDDGIAGDARGFVNDLVSAVGGSTDQVWTCETVGVGLVFCSAVVSASGDVPSDVRFTVQLRSKVTPVSLPRSFQGEVDIAVAVAPKK